MEISNELKRNRSRKIVFNLFFIHLIIILFVGPTNKNNFIQLSAEETCPFAIVWVRSVQLKRFFKTIHLKHRL